MGVLVAGTVVVVVVVALGPVVEVVAGVVPGTVDVDVLAVTGATST
jgi:hypothetical protein